MAEQNSTPVKVDGIIQAPFNILSTSQSKHMSTFNQKFLDMWNKNSKSWEIMTHNQEFKKSVERL